MIRYTGKENLHSSYVPGDKNVHIISKILRGDNNKPKFDFSERDVRLYTQVTEWVALTQNMWIT